MALKVEIVKGLVLTALFIMTFLFSMLPLKFISAARNLTQSFEKRKKWNTVISLLSCYAAGVFLATCLLDLFPDVKDKMSTTLNRLEIFTSFPVSEFVMICGLFIILITEQIVLSMKERHDHEERKPLLPKTSRNNINHDGHVQNEEHHHFEESLEGLSDQPISRNHSQDSLVLDSDASYENHRGHDHSMHVDRSSHSSVRAVILLLALSLHSVFEGLAVGLQPNTNAVLQIFLALILHKCILAFSLGLNLVQSKLSVKHIVYSNVLFSVTSPIGIGLGILIIDVSDSVYSSLINGILQGLACGTFLYVTFFEVLPHEFNSSDQRMLKLLFLILGYSTVTGLLFLDPTEVHPPCFHPS